MDLDFWDYFGWEKKQTLSYNWRNTVMLACWFVCFFSFQVNRLVAKGRTQQGTKELMQASRFDSSLQKSMYFFPGIVASDSWNILFPSITLFSFCAFWSANQLSISTWNWKFKIQASGSELQNIIMLFHIYVLYFFLAHLSTKCSWWAIVISQCLSCVVRRSSSTICFKS